MGELPARIGRYRVLGEVARGGMGAVLRAEDPSGRAVALKLMLAGEQATPLQRRRVATEVQSLLRLRHPHVVRLLDAGEFQGAPFLVMEWVEGETLAQRLRRAGPFEVDQAVELVLLLCDALEHCHAQGVLHRDLKPANVLLRAGDGAPLLTDFGLARDESGGEHTTNLKSLQGRWLGTPGYWPPEQARGELELIGPRSDVYGLGALLFAALTGHPPQDGSTLRELLLALDRPPRLPSQLRPGVPGWLDAACTRALASERDQRPASPAELARLLTLRGHSRPEDAPVVGAAPRGLLALAALVGCALVGGIALVLAVPVDRSASARTDPAEPLPTLSAATTSPETGTPAIDTHALKVRLGRALLASDYPAALKAVDELIAADPRDTSALVNRGVLLRQLGRRDEALESYAMALEIDPQLPGALANRANVHADQGNHAQALVDLRRACQLDPDVADFQIRLADALVQLDRTEEAVGVYASVLARWPDQVEAWEHRGRAHHLLLRHPEALEDLNRAVSLAPRRAESWKWRGVVRGNLGDGSQALSDLDQAAALDPNDPQVYELRGQLQERRGAPQAALADYERALRLEPERVEVLRLRALLLYQQRRYRESLRGWERLIELQPGSAPFWAARGSTRRALGQLREALADQERAIALDPLLGRAHRNRGNVLEDLGRYGDALRAFEQAIALGEEDADLQCSRARALAQLGRREDALAALTRAEQLDPEQVEIYMVRSVLARREGRLEEALVDCDRAIQLRPRDPEVWANRGTVRHELGREEEALQDLEQALGLRPDSDSERDLRALRARILAGLGR